MMRPKTMPRAATTSPAMRSSVWPSMPRPRKIAERRDRGRGGSPRRRPSAPRRPGLADGVPPMSRRPSVPIRRAARRKRPVFEINGRMQRSVARPSLLMSFVNLSENETRGPREWLRVRVSRGWPSAVQTLQHASSGRPLIATARGCKRRPLDVTVFSRAVCVASGQRDRDESRPSQRAPVTTETSTPITLAGAGRSGVQCRTSS